MPSQTLSPQTLPSWTCARCEVTVSWMNGTGAGLPASWAETDDGSLCLQCRRAIAEEMAIEAAGDGISREDRAQIRKIALLEFELLRDPERPNGEIAKACRSSVPAVVKARRRIEG